MSGTGTITKEYVVWCASCPQWARAITPQTQARAAKVFRKWGWSMRAQGWVCPACAKQGTRVPT